MSYLGGTPQGGPYEGGVNLLNLSRRVGVMGVSIKRDALLGGLPSSGTY